MHLLLKFQKDDGGRERAGFPGTAGDCVARAIAIATKMPYGEVADIITDLAKFERKGKRKAGISDSQAGVYKRTVAKTIEQIGWIWHPTMFIGSGCKVHLREGELPMDRLIVSVSLHLTAVIYGVIHDMYDPSRSGTRCVYGYWTKH